MARNAKGVLKMSIVEDRKPVKRVGDGNFPDVPDPLEIAGPVPSEVWPSELRKWGLAHDPGDANVVRRFAHVDSQEYKTGEALESRYKCSWCARFVSTFLGTQCRFCANRLSNFRSARML